MEVLCGQLDLQNWQTEAPQILAALVVDYRWCLRRLGSSSCLGLKDKSGLEALALKIKIHDALCDGCLLLTCCVTVKIKERHKERRGGVVEGRKEGRKEGWMDGWKEGWMDGMMEGWKDGRMEGWKDGRMEGWMDGVGLREEVRGGRGGEKEEWRRGEGGRGH